MKKMFTRMKSVTLIWGLIFLMPYFASAQCEEGEVQYTLTTVAGSFAGEVWWEILDSEDNVVLDVECNTADATSAFGTFNFCAEDGEEYTFNAYDSFGDGWNGGTWSIAYTGTDIVIGDGLANNGTPISDFTCAISDLEESFTWTALALDCEEPSFTAFAFCDGSGDEFSVQVDASGGSADTYDVVIGGTVVAAGITLPYENSFSGYTNGTAVTAELIGDSEVCDQEVTGLELDCSPICGTTWYDNGGPNGQYLNNTNEITTFCPDSPDDVVTVTFLSFDTEANWDKLYVFDGPNTSSPIISSGNAGGSGPCTTPGGFWGNLNNNLPGPFTSTHPSGCLTFQFCSDGSVTRDGWEASVTCSPAPNCTPPELTYEQLERDCETLTYDVVITVDEPSVPSSAPLLIATAIVSGETLPGIGGVFNNVAGSSVTVAGLPLDVNVLIEVNVLGFACPSFQVFSDNSNGCPIPLECGEPLELTYCYGDNEDTPFLYVSPDAEPVQFLFTEGLLAFGDFVTIYDGTDDTGDILLEATNGSLTGQAVLAESGSLFMKVVTNAFTSCQGNGFNTSVWSYTVGCGLDFEGCTDEDAANFSPIATIDNGSCVIGGEDCLDPAIVDALPYVTTANTGDFGNNYNSTNVPPVAPNVVGSAGAPSTFYLNGAEAVFSYTPTEDGFIDIFISGHINATGVWAFTGCPFESTVGFNNVSSADEKGIFAMPVLAGVEYFILVSTSAATTTTSFNLTIQNTVFDCPELDGNVGGFCEQLDGGPGQINEDCGCDDIIFDGCTAPTGFQNGIITPNCDAPAIGNFASFTNYHTVSVANGADYTFSSSPFGSFDIIYITIMNETGTEVLASGGNVVNWTSDFNGSVRFRTDGGVDCVSPGFFSHNRIVEVDCENIIYDCEEFSANIGGVCTTDEGFGTLSEDCECDIIEFDGCLTGSSFGTINLSCENPNGQQTGAWNNEFTTFNVQNGGTYTLSTSANPSVPLFFITVTNATGTEVLATGINELEYVAGYNGNARFYTHSNEDCGGLTGGVTSHTKFISLDCETFIFDCPDLEANFGAFCDLDGGPGAVNDDCECAEVDFDGCSTPIGFQNGTITPNCDAPVIGNFASFTNYHTVAVQNGAEYTFTSPAFGQFQLIYITILNGTGTEILASGANVLNWTATFNGNVRFRTDGNDDCTSPGFFSHTRTVEVNCETIIWDCPDLTANIGTPCDADGNDGIVSADCECIELIGTDCTNPFVVAQADLPYSLGGNTSTFGNNYLAADVPAQAPGAIGTGGFSNFYLNGDDVVFEFTPDEDTFVDVSVTENGSWVGLWAFTDCPFTSTVGWHTDAGTGNGRFIDQLPVNAGTTYYFVISTWPAPQSADFVFNLQLTEFDCPDINANIGSPCDFDGLPGITSSNCECLPLVGTDCTNPFVVEQANLPYNMTGNTSTFGNDYLAADVPPQAPGATGTGGFSTFYLNGDDVSFEFTPDSDTFIDISVVGTGTWVGLWVFTDCPFASTVAWHTGGDANGRFVDALPVDAGTTYYVVISTWPAPPSTTFNLTISETEFDCPELNGNIGDFCDLDGGPGALNEDCECDEVEFDGCDSPAGFQNGIITPNCDAPVVGNFASFTNYHTLAVQNGAEYTFTSPSFGQFQLIYITILNGTGTEILASGANVVNWTADFNGNVRFRTDGNADCTSPGFFSHTRTVEVNCETIIYDCPEFDGNVGDVCDNDGAFGQINDDCECDEIDFDGCTTGVSFGSANPTCANPTATVGGVWNGEYSTITVIDGALYNFSTSFNANVPLYFITITNSTGTQVLATGINSASWLSNISGTVRFYTHGSADCAGVTGGASSHTRTITVDCDPPVEPTEPTIWEIVQESEVHTTLEAAILAAGLDADLDSDEADLTVYAPTDEAFDALPDGLLEELLDDPDGLLTLILLYHAVDGSLFADDHTDAMTMTTLMGLDLTVTINAEGIFINDAQIIVADIEASNGVVHVIDAVLVPEIDESSTCSNPTEIVGAPTFAESQVSATMAGETSTGLEQCFNDGNGQADQWFSFESIATVMYIRAWGLNDFDAAVEVYSACGEEPIVCQDDAPAGQREIVILTETTPGETYYFRVYHAGNSMPNTLNYTAAVAHIPFTQLSENSCGVLDYTPADMITTQLPPNQFLLANWYFEFTELEAPFNTYEILSPNGANPNFQLQWFTQAEYGRTYSVRTRARMYQGPNWGDYGDACTIGFDGTPLTTKLKDSFANGFYDMCDILEADNVPGADQYRWRINDGFNIILHITSNRYLSLQEVPGLSLGSPYQVRVRARTLGQWSDLGPWRLFAMNNYVVETGVDQAFTACGETYSINQVINAVEICAAEFYTFRFTNVTNPSEADLFYTRDDGLRSINLNWVTGLVPGNTYEVQVLGGSGGLVGTYGYTCEITIEGDGSGVTTPFELQPETGELAEISMYPNPTMGGEIMLTISNLADAQQDIIIEVFDMYGKKVHSENVANNGTVMNTTVNFHNPLAAGIYTVNVISNDELVGAKKLVVQK